MLKQGTLLSELQSIVGKKHAREPKDDGDCAVDGLSPKAIVEPGTYEEVAQVLRFANTEHLAVIPRGSGFFMHLGNIPALYDIALSLKRLDKVIEHEPADLTVTCQAGISGEALRSCLDPSGQAVPFPSDPSTIGGQLAINEPFARLLHGTPRDFTIGMRVVTADGRMTKAGGRVVKNVAGFDLCKLYIGSFGTLGVIVEATLKVFPVSHTLDSTEFEFTSIEDISEFTTEVRRRGLAVTSIDIRRMMHPDGERYVPTSGYVCSVSITGSEAGVERSMREVRAIMDRSHAVTFDSGKLPKPGDKTPAWALREEPLTCQASVIPSVVPTLVHAFEDEAPGPFLDIAPALGKVTGTWLGATDQPGLVERLRVAATHLGGSLFVRACDPELKRRIDVFGPTPPSFPLMRAIKHQFDPNNVLSPGRFVGRL